MTSKTCCEWKKKKPVCKSDQPATSGDCLTNERRMIIIYLLECFEQLDDFLFRERCIGKEMSCEAGQGETSVSGDRCMVETRV